MALKSTVYHYLPRFLQWLLWDEEVRERFFQHPHYQFLLAQEAAFLKAEVEVSKAILSNLLLHPTWQQNQMCLNLLITERQRIEKWLKHPLAFFFPGTVKQLVDYQDSIQQSANRWMAKQLVLLEQSLENKENGSVNSEEKSVLESAFANIAVMQKEWTFSENILNELATIRSQYQALCHSEQNKTQSRLPEFVSPSLALRDQFRESIVQAIQIFEATYTASQSQLEPLKNQLRIDPALYDSAALRLWLENYLQQETTLSDELKTTLQVTLDQSQFREEALNRSENMALGALKKSSLFSLPKPSSAALDNAFSVFNEYFWDDNPQKFAQHCQAFKNAVVPLTDPASIAWNQKLCEYTHAFLKKIQALEKWEDFVLYRKPINELLQVLMDISATNFPALYQSLTHLAAAEKTLDEDSLDLFKEFSLAIPIRTLSAFLHAENVTEAADHNDAASYASQKVFSFLKLQTSNPPVSCSFTDLPVNRL